MRFILFTMALYCSISHSQIIDFENFNNLKSGDPVGEIKLIEADYSIQFYVGHNLNDTIPLTIQQVSQNSEGRGFYGPESNLDCHGNKIAPVRINQINDSKFVLNKKLTNRERVGCHFITGLLKDEILPSIFIFYDKPVTGCSADILDLDGHDNTIEAYDIYCYASATDYPLNPVNPYPIEIRSVGRTFGHGILGDNGGVMPFQINFVKSFTIIEIRPIQQVSGGNDLRTEFGFALDNYSPLIIEEAPYIPPYLTGEENLVTVEHYNETHSKKKLIERAETITLPESGKQVEIEVSLPAQIPNIDPIYFDFDQALLKTDGIKILDSLITSQNQFPQQSIKISAYCDPKGSNTYNDALSKKRANSVVSYLVDHGYPKSQILVNFFGEFYSGDTHDPDWKKRVAILEIAY